MAHLPINRLSRRDALALLVSGACASVSFGGEPKPVPSLQVLPLPEAQASFQRDGTELTRERRVKLPVPLLELLPHPSAFCFG